MSDKLSAMVPDCPGAAVPRERNRIGDVAERYGLTAHVLRAWEKRYGVFAPARTPGRYREYTAEDLRRVEHMVESIESGMTASEAARSTLEKFPHRATLTDMADELDARPGGLRAVPDIEEHPEDDAPLTGGGYPEDLARAWVEAWRAGDAARAGVIIAEVFDHWPAEESIGQFLMPAMAELGEMWMAGVVGIPTEHAAAAMAKAHIGRQAARFQRRQRLMSLPQVWLACPPGELHDLPLAAFGLVCRVRGWHVEYFGSNTPVDLLLKWRSTPPAAIVFASTSGPLLSRRALQFRELSEFAPLFLGGRGATSEIAEQCGAIQLTGGVVEEGVALLETVEKRAPQRHQHRVKSSLPSRSTRSRPSPRRRDH